MKLTNEICHTAEASEKRRKLSDGGGLQLWIQPTGSRHWYLTYQYQKVQKQVALGSFPVVLLSEARKMRLQAHRLLRKGIDPASFWRAEAARRKAGTPTFRDVAAEFLDKRKRESISPVTLSKKEWLLSLVYSRLGNTPISEIRPPDVLQVLRRLERRGTYETARRVRSTVGAVCRFAIATGISETDPTFALRDAIITPTVTPRAAITDPREFGSLLRAIDGYDGKPMIWMALKLLALLFPRQSELRLAKWGEFDLDNALWRVPAERTKMRREHKVFLAPQTLAILEELRKLTGHREFLLPGLHSARKPLPDGCFNRALRQIGYDKSVMTPHGFRATACSLLNESGLWNPDAIERQLAHVESNNVRRVYARGIYWNERVRMMIWWADYLDALRAGQGIGMAGQLWAICG